MISIYDELDERIDSTVARIPLETWDEIFKLVGFSLDSKQIETNVQYIQRAHPEIFEQYWNKGQFEDDYGTDIIEEPANIQVGGVGIQQFNNEIVAIKINIQEGMPISIFIKDDPSLYDIDAKNEQRELLENILYKYEVRYLNIDKILFIEPISETGYTKITLINKDEIECEQPLHEILNQIRNAK
jgi:hypothetical protein